MNESEVIIRTFGKLFFLWSPIIVPVLIGLIIGIKKENEQERMASVVKRLEIERRKTA